MVTDRDIYFFDLRGFLVLEGALSRHEVQQLNDRLDAMPRLEVGEWYGYVHAHTFGDRDGLNYQQVYEAGAPFERLIDHPSWFDKVRHFVGGEGSFDEHHGPLFIDENFVNLRGPGEAIGLHNGGHLGLAAASSATSAASSTATRSTSWWRSPTSGPAMAARC